MPAKKLALPGTLAHLAECGRQVYIVCGKCERFTVADLQKLAQRSGWRSDVTELGLRLRCLQCGHRGARLTCHRPRMGGNVCPRCLRSY